jgi:hypothetical protein
MDKKSDRPSARERRTFWTPLWIALVIAIIGAAYELGKHVRATSSNDGDLTAWALAATRNPVDGIAEADKLLRSRKIEFDTYRDIIRAALRQPNSETIEAAFDSMSRVLSSGYANQRYLAKAIGQMPHIVLLSLSADDDRAKGVADEIRASGFEVTTVGRNSSARQSAIVCYHADTCKEALRVLSPLLKIRGFDVQTATPVNRDIQAFESGNEANAAGKSVAVTAYEKRIDLVLAAPAPAAAKAAAKKK